MDASAGGGLAPALAGSAPHGVVLTEPRLDEAAFVEEAEARPDASLAFADALHRQTMAFLADCRAAIRVMMPAGKGHLLALCIDDAAAKILGLPQTPIANQARAAALKSMAKEYGRMGLGFNTVVCQPPREMAEESAWRARRERLKVYALRYRPIGNRQLRPLPSFHARRRHAGQRRRPLPGQRRHGDDGMTMSNASAGIVLITGATRGIGRAIAERFAREGCRLALVYRSGEAAARETRDMLAETGAEAEMLCADLGDTQACRTVVDRVVARYGGLDVLINNAGGTHDGAFATMPPGDYAGLIRTNLSAPIVLALQAAPYLIASARAERGGAVVMMASLAGVAGKEGQIPYATTKAASSGPRGCSRGTSAAAGCGSMRSRPASSAPGWSKGSSRGCTPMSSPPARRPGWAIRRRSPRPPGFLASGASSYCKRRGPAHRRGLPAMNGQPRAAQLRRPHPCTLSLAGAGDGQGLRRWPGCPAIPHSGIAKRPRQRPPPALMNGKPARERVRHPAPRIGITRSPSSGWAPSPRSGATATR